MYICITDKKNSKWIFVPSYIECIVYCTAYQYRFDSVVGKAIGRETKELRGV